MRGVQSSSGRVKTRDGGHDRDPGGGAQGKKLDAQWTFYERTKSGGPSGRGGGRWSARWWEDCLVPRGVHRGGADMDKQKKR